MPPHASGRVHDPPGKRRVALSDVVQLAETYPQVTGGLRWPQDLRFRHNMDLIFGVDESIPNDLDREHAEIIQHLAAAGNKYSSFQVGLGSKPGGNELPMR